LKVVFNPKTVRAYRLLGHEAGATTVRPEADFCAGQSATALYEVRLGPGGGKDVATVELTWRPAGGGATRYATARVHRDRFAPSLIEAPSSLQAAAVAAETAEVLRESFFVGRRVRSRPGSLRAVLELAKHLDTQLRERPSFVEFLSTVQQAAKVRSR